jgi:hypothetical protein
VVFAAACSTTTNTDTQRDLRYDVADHGVATSPIDPSDGTFVAPVQISADWVAMKPSTAGPPLYLPVSTNTDLSYYHFGRAGLTYPSATTPVDIELTGLDWHMGDDMQMVSPNTGLSIHQLDTHFPYPRAGATTLTGRMNWMSAMAPLVEQAKGDTLYVAQMTDHTSDAGPHYTVLSHVGRATDLDLVDRGTATLSAQLSPIAADQSLTLHLNGSAFGALAAEAGPNTGKGLASTISVRTLPEALAQNNNFADSFYMYLPSLVDFGQIPATAEFDQTIAFGNPFATATSKWTDFVTVVYPMPVLVPNVGATHAMAVQATPVSALAGGGDIAPAISPVRNVRVNGVTADAPRSGVGTTPVISWEPPAIGTATNYAVTVDAIVKTKKAFTIRRAGTFRTTTTSIRLPSVATAQISSYVLTVTAIAAEGRDLSTRPFVGTLPYAAVDYVTAQITP